MTIRIPLIGVNSRLKVGWDLLVAGTVLYSALVVPFRIVAGSGPIDPLYWSVTAILLADIVVVFDTTARRGMRKLNDRRAIADAYLHGWFWIDLAAALPLAPLCALVPPGSAVAGILPMIRLCKLLRVPGIFRHVQEALGLGPSVTRLSTFAFWFALAAHLMALGWIAIGAAETGRPFGDQYLRALYWTITTIATIGYGDYYPSHDSNLQIVYTMAVQLVGVGMYGYIIGNVATLIANLDVARREFVKKIEVIDASMRARRIPAPLQEKVREYYRYLWHTRQTADDATFLAELPPSLRTEIALHLNRSVLEKVSILKGADEIFIREVVQLLEPLVFLPGDYIIRQGEFGDCLYFLSSGQLEVIVDGDTVARLEPGSPFGETSLLHGKKRNASVRATSYCDVYRLTKHNFDGLRAKYPEFDRKLQAVVEERKGGGQEG